MCLRAFFDQTESELYCLIASFPHVRIQDPNPATMSAVRTREGRFADLITGTMEIPKPLKVRFGKP